MNYVDKFVRVTGPEFQGHPLFGKAGLVVEVYEDDTVLVHFKGRQFLVVNIRNLAVIEGL